MNLDNLPATLTPGFIEDQEKAGQIAELERQTLPLDLFPPRPVWESAGFVFHEPIDDLFVSVTFPTGWTKRATDHSMWTDIIDADSRKRGAIFYKAAFYDLSAAAHLSTRFSVIKYAEHNATQRKTVIRDAANKAESIVGIRDRTDHNLGNQHEAEAIKWLDEYYPNWRNPLAYWNHDQSPNSVS